MITVSTRLDENKMKEIEELAAEMNLDKASLIRKFILDGYQHTIIVKYLKKVHQGELSIGQAAKKAGATIYRMLEVARELEITIGADSSTIPYEIEVLKRHLAE
jgi:hypothetical protein